MQSMNDSENANNSAPVNGVTPWLGSQIQKILDGIYAKYKDVDDGAVATYIPNLEKPIQRNLESAWQR